jgi:hypothetical protein
LDWGSVDDLYGNDGITVDGEMSERTIMAVVSDLLKTGLTVEQQILVNELAMAVADQQRKADQREKWAAEKRVQRQSADRDIYITNSSLEKNISPERGSRGKGTNPRALGTNPRKQDPSITAMLANFSQFWLAYPRREGKGAALKAYKNALKRASFDEIKAGAERYAKICADREKQYIKQPTTWLNADCWLDEDGGKVVDFRPSAPQRTWAEIKAEREAKEQTQ